MKRLFWVGVGVGLTVVVVRYGRKLVAQYVPADARRALDTAAKVTRTARGLRAEFAAGVAEREAELRHALLGDVDLDDVKVRGRAAVADLRDRGARRNRTTRPGRIPSQWAEGPLEDPDDDDGYTFF
jgi:DNA-binding protein